MKLLNLFSVTKIDELAYPEEIQDLNLESPALRFFTDFLEVKPRVIESTVSAIDAKMLMQKTHVRMKFIINESNEFIGIIRAEDLINSNIIRRVAEGEKRHEITLKDLMIPKKDLKALDYDEVSQSTIRNVIMTLKNNGRQHCLVIERNQHKIRGIFSASDISRKLHLPINIQQESSFYKIFLALEEPQFVDALGVE